MSNVGVPKIEKLIETSEVLRRVPCSRSQFSRVRRDYGLIQPAQTVGHGLLLWPESIVAMVRSVLQVSR